VGQICATERKDFAANLKQIIDILLASYRREMNALCK
jgi:hypothetical protein